MKKLIIFFFLITTVSLSAQHRIGVRAGLNYSTYLGELEEGEDYGIGSGFHFGINYTYEFNDILGLRGELLYTQRGTTQSFYRENNYHIIRSLTIDKFVEYGTVDLNMDLANSYFSVPITAQVRVHKKIELFAGMSVDFLIGPSGRGKLDFTSSENMDEIFFIQSYDHRYNSDVAGQYNTIIQDRISIIVDGDKVSLPKIVGGYYIFDADQKTGNRYNGIDAHLILGGNYFINPGFYVGARVEYGLTDITNNAMDYSLTELDELENFIFRDDKDRSFSVNVSFGFRF